ncbi:MAG: hypothetical protein K9W45_05575 [Candidatus Heimdallarchaeum aukensis]|uniref:Uncharacterized protein n=1 Tax=Candidatus Heimdallarchaeum aukensis TaxID=2876573 RepID=A0A9Y1BMZ3_9ARCH|nr:MAG: hypothetical protein K9W45_05575 [Candidatus Heimdallarchaeum aukensis]
MKALSIQKFLEDIEKFGLSKTYIDLLSKNKELFSKEKITEILTENLNIYTDYSVLLDFLNYVWSKENSSPLLLYYLSGIVHRLFYLTREYFEKKENHLEQSKKHVSSILSKLEKVNPNSSYKEQNSNKERKEKGTNFHSARDFILFLKSIPKIDENLFKCLKITGKLFFSLLSFPQQQICNANDQAMYISRVFLLWKLNALTDQQMIKIFEYLKNNQKNDISLDEFTNILFLEFKNYQFLQLGINREIVSYIAQFILSSFEK